MQVAHYFNFYPISTLRVNQDVYHDCMHIEPYFNKVVEYKSEHFQLYLKIFFKIMYVPT